MGGGELHLAVGDVVVLRKNESVGPVQMRNGRRAVVEAIDDDRTLMVAWNSPDGTLQRAALTPGDVVAGQVASSYLEADHVQGAAAGTVHVSQGRSSDYAVAVIDPRANAATYVALSRDRQQTTIVLSAEAVATTPEELAGWKQLPTLERDAVVVTAYAALLREAGVRKQPTGSCHPGLARARRLPAATDRGSSGRAIGGESNRRPAHRWDRHAGAATDQVSLGRAAPGAGQAGEGERADRRRARRRHHVTW